MQGLADSEGYLMVTWSNHHYVDFVRTWVKHVTGVGVSGYVVGAMDEVRRELPVIYNACQASLTCSAQIKAGQSIAHLP